MKKWTDELTTMLGLGSIALAALGFLPLYTYYSVFGLSIVSYMSVADLTLDAAASVLILIVLVSALGIVLRLLTRITFAIVRGAAWTVAHVPSRLQARRDYARLTAVVDDEHLSADLGDGSREESADKSGETQHSTRAMSNDAQINALRATALQKQRTRWHEALNEARETWHEFLGQHTWPVLIVLAIASTVLWTSVNVARARCISEPRATAACSVKMPEILLKYWPWLFDMSEDARTRNVSITLRSSLALGPVKKPVDGAQNDHRTSGRFIKNLIAIGGTQNYVFVLSPHDRKPIALARSEIIAMDHGTSITSAPAEEKPDGTSQDFENVVSVDVGLSLRNHDWFSTHCSELPTSARVRFAPGSYTYDADVMSGAVEELTGAAQRSGADTLWLVGYADPTGTPIRNLALSEKRAQSIGDILGQALEPLMDLEIAGAGARLHGRQAGLQASRTVALFDCRRPRRLARSVARGEADTME